MKKLVIAAPKSGSGKTILTCGLLELLKRKQIPTASFKCGPDYIDPLFHKRIIGVESRNLDSFFESPEGLRTAFWHGCEGKDNGFALIEGVMGYFDGLGGISLSASTCETAEILQAPVILTVDARGSSLSLAALIQGFLNYCPSEAQMANRGKSRIKGVILNQVSPMIYPRLKKLLESELGIQVAGYIPHLDFLQIESRHLGLVLPDEIENLKEQIQKLADVLEETLDWDCIMNLAEEEEFPYSDKKRETKPASSFRLGVALDEAFCFYYEENLRVMKEQGASLEYISLIHDKELPEGLDGLLIGGGYPELYADKLAENKTMRSSVYEAARNGMAIHGECGGYLYLLETLQGADGKSYPMCGVFKGAGQKGTRLGNFGYITLKARNDSRFFKKGAEIKAHEFHYWKAEEREDRVEHAIMDAVKPIGSRQWAAMEQRGCTLAGFPHFYYRSCPEFAETFAAACLSYQKSREGVRGWR